METPPESSPKDPTALEPCLLCRRPAQQWLLRIAIEDTGGLKQEGFICANCAVKLRLASEKNRDLQIDPWIHDAIAHILRGVQTEQS
ncbi:MAG: hypothetical protein WBE78_08110 [Candidatus Binataceae bacterium]|jgi:hypothetical protein